MNTPRVKINLGIYEFFKALFFKLSLIKENKAINIFKKRIKKKHLCLVSMCRTGLILSLHYLKHKNPKKNEIIVFSYNLKELVEIISNEGFKIKYVDIEKNGLPSIKSVEKKISNKTAAVMLTNMFNSYDYSKKIKKLTKKNNIILIEDNAIYLGNFQKSKNNKIYAGSIGDISLFSFGIMKNLCAIYGGALATDIDGLKEFAIKEISSYKKFSSIIFFKKVIMFFILKFFLSKLIYKFFFQKIILFIHKKNKLKLLKFFYPSLNYKKKYKTPDWYFSKIHPVAKRIVINAILNDNLKIESKIRNQNNIFYKKYLKKNKNIRIFNLENTNYQNFLEFPIFSNNKKFLVQELLKNKYDIRTYYYYDCFYIENKFTKNKNSMSKSFEKNIICLPNHSLVKLDYIKNISKLINKHGNHD